MPVKQHSGVRPLDNRLTAYVSEDVRAWVKQKIGTVRVDTSYDVPLIACRSLDCSTVYIDRRLPKTMNAGKPFSPADTLPWHEVSEWHFMHVVGLSFDDSHRLATYAFERPFVEAKGLSWITYQEAFGGQITASEKRTFTNPPPDLDLAPYKQQGDTSDLPALEKAQAKKREG